MRNQVHCARSARLLAGRIGRYGGYQEQMVSPIVRRELPSNAVTVVIGWGDSIILEGGKQRHCLRSFIVGPRDEPCETTLPGLQHGLQLQLSPLTAYSLFGVSMHALGNDIVDMNELLGPSAHRLAERLHDASTWTHRFEILDITLSTLLDAGPSPDPAVVWAWRQLRSTAGCVRIGGLAQELGWSRRHLTRKFSQYIGLAPKTVAQLFRIERAIDLLADTSRTVADVAATVGYADQAHFCREIRAFTACTPTELSQEPPTATISKYLAA